MFLSKEMKYKLEKLRLEVSRWQRQSRQQAAKYVEQADMQTPADKEKYLAQVAGNRVEQFQLLTRAMGLRLSGGFLSLSMHVCVCGKPASVQEDCEKVRRWSYLSVITAQFLVTLLGASRVCKCILGPG